MTPLKDGQKWLDEIGQEELSKLGLFLDFDGTLAPIVERPAEARALGEIPPCLKALGKHLVVAVISGRGLDDVRSRLGVDDIFVAGSHGMEIIDPEDRRHEPPEANRLLELMDEIEEWMRRRFDRDDHLEVERKRFGVALHYRRKPEMERELKGLIEAKVEVSRGVKVGYGKKVIEIQPDLDWDKGTALAFILDEMDPPPAIPIFVGDDLTDEDAFALARQRGGEAILVHEGPITRRTNATMRLKNPEEVLQFLERLQRRVEVS